MILFTKLKFKNYIAITIYPFIIIHKDYKGNLGLVNHEKIHLKQQIELFWLFFFIWYVVEFVVRCIQYKNWYLAYRNISFEREAYQNEKNQNYLSDRKIFSFFKYL